MVCARLHAADRHDGEGNRGATAFVAMASTRRRWADILIARHCCQGHQVAASCPSAPGTGRVRGRVAVQLGHRQMQLRDPLGLEAAPAGRLMARPMELAPKSTLNLIPSGGRVSALGVSTGCAAARENVAIVAPHDRTGGGAGIWHAAAVRRRRASARPGHGASTRNAGYVGAKCSTQFGEIMETEGRDQGEARPRRTHGCLHGRRG